MDVRESLFSAIGADAVKNRLVRGQGEAVVGQEVIFQAMDEAAVYAYSLFTFCTFYMKMLGMAVRTDSVGGARSLFAYESGYRSVFYEVVKCPVYRGLRYRLAQP